METISNCLTLLLRKVLSNLHLEESSERTLPSTASLTSPLSCLPSDLSCPVLTSVLSSTSVLTAAPPPPASPNSMLYTFCFFSTTFTLPPSAVFKLSAVGGVATRDVRSSECLFTRVCRLERSFKTWASFFRKFLALETRHKDHVYNVRPEKFFCSSKFHKIKNYFVFKSRCP